MFGDWVAHPLFVPPDFIHAVVMASAVGDSDMIEIVVGDECAHGVLTSGGATVDSDARQIHPWTRSGGSFDP